MTKDFIAGDLTKIMATLGLEHEPIPLWWTTDFINSSPPGTATKDEKWIVGEFNCSCVGISKCLPAYCKDDTPNACYNDVPKKDLGEIKKIGGLVGKKALGILVREARSKQSEETMKDLKLVLGSVDSKLASNEGLVAKLLDWKRTR